jgi:hypothetical protein
VVDISWVPLYIAGAPFYTPQQVYNYFNLFWASKSNGECWTAKTNLTDNCNEYWVPGREAQTMGAIMSTWTAQQPDELGLVRMRSGALAEHIWNWRPFPYPQHGNGSWEEFQPRWLATDALLDNLIGKVARYVFP